MKIVEVPYGVASRYDNLIEINRKLKGKLRDKILAHEIRHANGVYNKEDWKNDYNSEDPYFWQSISFCIRNPEGFIGFFPIMYSYYLKRITFNFTAIFPLVLYCFFWCLAVILLFKVGIVQAVTAYINIIALFNVVLLVYTHLYVKLTGFKSNIK